MTDKLTKTEWHGDTATERLRSMLEHPSRPIAILDFAELIGWTPSWLRRSLRRAGNAARYTIPPEVFLLAAQVPGMPADLLAGTPEERAFLALPVETQAFIQAIADYNLRQAGHGAAITRQRIRRFFADRGVDRPETFWQALLDGTTTLAKEDAELARIREVVGLPPLPRPPIERREFDRLIVDRLVRERLRNVAESSIRWEDADEGIRARVRTYLENAVGAVIWNGLPPGVRARVEDAVAVVWAKAVALQDSRRRPDVFPAGESPASIIAAVAQQLPVIPEVVEPAARRLGRIDPDQRIVDAVAPRIEASETEVAAVLLGLGAGPRHRAVVDALRAEFAPRRGKRRRPTGRLVLGVPEQRELDPADVPRLDSGRFRRAWAMTEDDMAAIVRFLLREFGRPVSNAELAGRIQAGLGCGAAKAQEVLRVACRLGAVGRVGQRYTVAGSTLISDR